MKDKIRIYGFFVAVMLAVGLLSVSCRKEDKWPPLVKPEPEIVNAWLSLNLNVVSSGAHTKVNDYVEGAINGDIDENIIKHIVVWLVPVDDNGMEDWDETIMTYVQNVNLSSHSDYIAPVKARLNVPMNLYVAANITTNVASAFLYGGPEAVYRAVSDDYQEVIGEFASKERGIAMFCIKKSSIEFDETNSEKTTAARIDEDGDGEPEDVDLVRMLAKVHMLFKCYDFPNDGFVRITEPGSLTPASFGKFGWSRMEDISYILNTVNTGTRILQPAYGGPYESFTDINHSMSGLLVKGLEWDYKAEAADQFIGFEGDLFSDDWNSLAAKPEKFDSSREPFGSGDPYYRGLYCFENTTNDDLLDQMTDDEKKYVPFKVATHLIVKSRFVPRYINTVAGDGSLTEVDHGQNGYDAALAFLVEVSGVDEDGNPHTYPAGTFFTRDMQEFYDYAGMLKLIETVPEIRRHNFAAYPGGYGFYHSYIYGGTDTTTGQVTFAGTDSGVFRNHYHFLTCSLMKVPATPGSFNQLMMVNSKVVEWNAKGKQEIIVKPNI